MIIGHLSPLTVCLFVFGTELSHMRSSQSEYARGTHPTFSYCECPLHPVTTTSLPPSASSRPFSGPRAFLEAEEASPEQSPVTHIQALLCASPCLPPPVPGLSSIPPQLLPVHSGLQITHPPLPSRELKYVIQRFAEDPRQEVSLFLFYFFFFPIVYWGWDWDANTAAQ